jgi:hypothetical protein
MSLPIIDQIADNVTLTLAAPDRYVFTLTVDGGSLDDEYTVDKTSFTSWSDGGSPRLATITTSGGFWVLTVLDSSLVQLITFKVTTTGNLVPPTSGWVFDTGGGLPGGGSVSGVSKEWDMNNPIIVVDDLKTPQRFQDGLAQISYDDPQVEDDAPINHEQFTAAFHVIVTLAVSTATDTPLTEKAYQIEADIIKRLMVDYTRGALAVDTVPAAGTMGSLGDGGWAVISVNFSVRFRTLYGDRFSQ